ncbi:hypothetical protein EMPS_03400 [Entomortierella parvispora]|uniref:DUF1749 domain-containing protein n=1 Tax=Entomortierella parvispora TaxID=205924 RepID=A0A9P3LUU8_9FUNG|nr:hypothetical protein EMPS_03400 [Entomortierella parvispora]
MILQGTLSTYNPQTRLTMFESGPQHSSTSVLFIGGLMDGYNAVPYLPLLNEALANELGVSLIQVMLSSSHAGYGTATLMEDVWELDALLTYLREQRNKTRIFIIGHSTGSQDAIKYVTYGKNQSVVKGIVLQGAVSDREFLSSSVENYGKYLRLAQRMINDGNGQELMVREVDVAPITANRFFSLAAVGGDDDMFSSDIPFEALHALFKEVKMPLIMVHSGKDEYIPSRVNKEKLYTQLAKASPTCLGAVVLPEADHVISDQPSQITFCKAVVEFIQRVVVDLDRLEQSQQQSFDELSL